MRTRRTVLTATLSAGALLVGTAVAYGHENEVDDGALHDNKQVLHEQQHDSDNEGHIDQDVNYGFEEVGQDTLGGVEEGRYTDVWADDRGYAYVGTFQEPTCDRSGVYISDISDPTNPTTVGMIKSPPNTRVNDVKTIDVGSRTVLIHTLEECGLTVPSGQKGQGGISLYDVTDPARPSTLKKNFLDTPVHNTFPWTDTSTGRSYLIVTLDEGERDTLFVDITKPQRPRVLSTVGLPDWPGAQDAQADGLGSFAASFNHDVWVANIGTDADPDYQAVVSYWDAGFVTLDVNDPSNPEFVDDSTYPDPDPVTDFSPPEGNGHAAAYNSDGTQIFAGDEDFSGFRTTFEITDGGNAGEYPASEGSFTSPIVELDDQRMDGETTYLGEACGGNVPQAAGTATEDQIAVIQRGTCTFQLKADTAKAAGYDGFIVFNDAARGDAVITMGGDSSALPGIFVGHSTGLDIFDATDESLTIGAPGATIAATAEFDGFGYFHLLDRKTLAETGYYAPAQVNDPEFATGFGDLTMHNVEGDITNADVALISWYSLGLRAIEVDTGNSVTPPPNEDGTANTAAAVDGVDDYYGENVTEVGRWIAPGGSNFWGVTQTVIGGERYVLASDRNTGLHIFTFDPATPPAP